ncbi:MAG: mechanosensitive ion channel family protein [Bacteroidales bacterium]|nr:mechanosensitive ion channel family protein [Bacteroidales bacterium]
MGVEILEYIQTWLQEYKIANGNEELFARIILGGLVVAVSILSAYISRWIITSPLRKLASRSKVKWDDKLFERKLPNRISNIVPAIIVYLMLPSVLPQDMFAYQFCAKLSVLYIIAEVMRTISGLITFAYDLAVSSERFKDRSLKGIFQVFQMLMVFIGILVMIAVMIDESIGTLIAGLGASAAILTLIFKDSFVGLIAGIQLSYNDMLRPGDWITVPGKNIDGDVLEVTLNTVKVRNFDNTITTIPPIALMNDSFQNWRGMSESNGRRIKRAIEIDMYCIEFAREELIAQLSKKYKAIADYVANRSSKDKERGDITNIKLFRVYIESYIRNNSDTAKDATKMVRYLEPSSEGLPFEIYFFSANKDWVYYENFASDVMDHIIAVMSDFELKPYQRASGVDNRKTTLRANSK